MLKHKKLLILFFLFLFCSCILVLVKPVHANNDPTVTVYGASGCTLKIQDTTLATSTSGSSPQSLSFNPDDTLVFTATKPSGTYGFSEWEDYPSGVELSYNNPLTSSGNTESFSIEAIFLVSITANSAYGTVSNPNTVVQQGGSDDVSVSPSTVSLGTGEQAISTGYSTTSYGSSGGTSIDMTNIQTDQTVTFNWQLQYYLTVSSSYGSPSGAGWYNAGATAYAGLSAGIVSTGTGTQEVFLSWNYDSGTNYASDAVTMNSAITDTASWQAQCYLTVTGGSSTSGQGWYVNSGSATASSSWVWGISGGTRSALTNWQLDGSNQNPARQDTGTLTTSSITMSAPHTVNFVSTTQYFLTVSGGNGISYGTASPTSDNWYDSGTSTTVSSNWVWAIVSGQSQYAITNYAIDGSNQNPTRQESGTLTTSSVTMNTYHTVAFASTTQYYFSVSSSYGSPTGQAWYDTGSSVSSTVTTPVSGGTGTQYVTSSWTGTGSLSSGGSQGSSSTGSFSITAYSTCTWNWITQYYITVSSNYGNPTETSQWVNSGSSFTVTITSPYSTGTGSQEVCTSSTSQTINPVSSPQTLTFTWQAQYYVTSHSDSYSSITASAWENSGYSPTFSYSPSGGYTIVFVIVDGGSNIVGSYPSSYTFTSISTPHTIQVSTSAILYTITVTSASGNPTASGQVAQGGSYATNVNSPYAGGTGIEYNCTGYSIDSGTLTYGTSYTFTNVQANHTITYSWQTQYYLTVTSAYGSPVGYGWYNATLSASFSVPTPVSGGTGIQYVFSSWAGSGSGAYSGSSSSTSVTMNNPITETASWTTQYYLTVSSFYGTPSGSGWYSSGSLAYAGLNSGTISGSGVQYVFISWSTGGTTYSQSTTITMNSPVTSSASWQTQYEITASADANSTISSSGSNYYVSGSSPTFTYSATSGHTLTSVLVDGSAVNMTTYPSSYAFPNISTSHTISVNSEVTPAVEIDITQIVQSTTRTGINQNVNLSYELVYSSNSSAVTTGTITINSIQYSVNAGWVNFTVTNSRVSLVTYTVNSVNCGGITSWSQTPTNPQVIYDNLQVVLSASNGNQINGEPVTITWQIYRQYDGSYVTSFTVNVTRDGTLWLNNTSLSSATDTDTSTTHTYTFSTITDNTYGITYSSFIITPLTATWGTTSTGGISTGSVPITSTPAPSSTQPQIVVNEAVNTVLIIIIVIVVTVILGGAYTLVRKRLR